MTARASVTMDWKDVEGSRRRNLSVMFGVSSAGVVAGVEDSLAKKSRPSLEGWVRAERREEMWWRTGVDDSNCGLDICFESLVVVWAA